MELGEELDVDSHNEPPGVEVRTTLGDSVEHEGISGFQAGEDVNAWYLEGRNGSTL